MKFLSCKRPQASIILLGSVFSIALAGNAPAQATGFLDTSTLSNQCSSDTDLGCVNVINSTSFTLYGKDSYDTTTSTGFAAQSSPYTVAFNYSFNRESGQTAFYSIDGIESPLNDPSGSSSFTVQNNQTLAFGVNSGQNLTPAELEIKNFQTEGVPAPLSALGAGAAFGWIRRRRAQLKAQQSFHL